MYAGLYRTERPIFETPRRGRPLGQHHRSLVRAFYCELLGGREVWPTEHNQTSGGHWFLVGETLVEVTTTACDLDPPVELEVNSPHELLERAWDAGYTVQVRDEETRASVSILDPFGRRIDLLPRTQR